MKKLARALVVGICVCAAWWIMWEVKLKLDEGARNGSTSPVAIDPDGEAGGDSAPAPERNDPPPSISSSL